MSLRKCTKSRIVRSNYILPEELYRRAKGERKDDRFIQLLLPTPMASWTSQQVLYTNTLGLRHDQNFRILTGGIPNRIRAFINLVDK